jgi:hypothetical protein
MANITVSSTQSNISVDSTTNTVTVTSVPSNITVSPSLSVPNSVIRNAISNTFPILYDVSTGVISIDEDAIVDETVVDNGALSGNITLDLDAGRLHKVDFAGNISGIDFTNMDTGASATVIFTQDGIGGSILDVDTYPSLWTDWKFASSSTDVDSSPSAWTVMSVFYDGTDHYASLVLEQSISIQTADIQDGAVTTAKIEDGAVTNPKLANSNIIINGTVATLGGNVTLEADANLESFSVTTASASGNGTLSYSNTTGVFTFTPADTSLATKTTDDLTEGSTNQYFTTDKANTAIGAYTGTITGLTGGLPNLTDDVTTTGIITAGNDATDTHSFTGNIDVTGNIEVSGNLNYRNVEDLYVQDQSITLNANAASDADIFIIANRPSGSNAWIQWNETTDRWGIRPSDGVTVNIPLLTDYSVTQNPTFGGATGSLSYNNTTGVFTYTPPDVSLGTKDTDDLAEGSTNLYLNGAGTTDNLTEGSINEYYTTDKANTAIGAYTGSISNLTGVLATTGNLDLNSGTAVDNLYGLKWDSSVNKFISSPDAGTKAPDHFITIEKEGTDLEAIRGRIARSGAFGWEELYEKAEGTLASPTALGNDDELWRVDYLGHDGTDYGGSGNKPSLTMRVFQDDETSGVSTGIVPLTYEIAGQLDGNLSPFPTSFMSIHSDGKIVFNDAGTRSFNSKTGTANISRDGSIVSAADITSRTSLIGAGLTVADITYPTSDGTSGQAIVTDGNGNLTFGAVATTYGDSNVDLHLNTATATTGQILSWDGADYDWIDDGSSNADIANFLANGFGSNTITTTGDITANEFIGDLDGHVATGVYNNTGGTLTKGTPVYISGANGDEANVAPAENDDSTKMPAMGIIKENISAGASGQAVVSGVMNYSSHGFTLGADLYINDAGGLTDIEPGGESALLQKIGKALTSNFIIVQGAGRTNATPNLDVGNIFLGNASGKAVTASLSDQISAFSGDITQMNEANISRIYVGEDNLGLDSGLVTFTDLQMVKNGDSNFTSKQMSRNTNTGIQDYYVRSRGSETSPTTINSNDRIHDNLYYAHDGTGFEKTFGQHIYQDSDTGGVSTGVVPLGMEIYTRYLGDSSAPFDMSIVKFRSNRSIEFNDQGTRGFGTGVGNANITQDGTINTVSGINATGNITTTSNLKTGLIRLPDSEPANSNIQIFANVIINDEDVLGIGSSQDLELVYDGTDSIIHNKTGNELLIKSDTTDIQLSNGTSVAEFTSSGINTTGLTVASITYPVTDGSNNQVLTTNGAGTLSFTDVGAAYGNVEVENFLSANVVTANIDTQGNINVNQDIVVENDVTAANAVFTSSLQPATSGGTITCQSLRVNDFAMTEPLGLNIVANSSLNSGAYVNPFKGSLVHVTGDRYGSDGAPAYWNGTNWKYLSDDANVTI